MHPGRTSGLLPALCLPPFMYRSYDARHVSTCTRQSGHQPGEFRISTPIAFIEGKFVPLADANVNIVTHSFNYGTAVFEGVRGNWNDDQGELYLFMVREHIQRIRQSAKIMRMD